MPAGMNKVVVGFLQRAPHFTWERADLRDAVFWVEELGRRVGKERRWREGERSHGDPPLSYTHSMVSSLCLSNTNTIEEAKVKFCPANKISVKIFLTVDI